MSDAGYNEDGEWDESFSAPVDDDLRHEALIGAALAIHSQHNDGTGSTRYCCCVGCHMAYALGVTHHPNAKDRFGDQQ